MKILKQKISKQIIITLLVLIMLFSIFQPISNADGGSFFEPIFDFLTGIADIILNMLQRYFLGYSSIGNEELEAVQFLSTGFGQDFEIAYSPGTIFSNKIPAFDINFMDPMEDFQALNVDVNNSQVTRFQRTSYFVNQLHNYGEKEPVVEDSDNYLKVEKLKEDNGYYDSTLEIVDVSELQGNVVLSQIFNVAAFDNWTAEIYKWKYNGKTYYYTATKTEAPAWFKVTKKDQIETNDSILIWEWEYKQDEIIDIVEIDQSTYNSNVNVGTSSNQPAAGGDLYQNYPNNGNPTGNGSDKSEEEAANELGEIIETIFNGTAIYSTGTRIEENGYFIDLAYYLAEPKVSTASILQSTIATWYNTLRVLALVGLLSVLVYVGIRILISSTGKEKVKYKNLIKDWLVAVCLLFVLHYIMVATIEIVEEIIEIFSKNIVVEIGEEAAGGGYTKVKDELVSSHRNSMVGNEGTAVSFSNTIIYIVLVIYTIVFSIYYFKRTIYMAFLTMVAPLVALTYPLDKIKDGQAQAFNFWLREYIFNAMIQPVHLVLYYIFVSSSMDLSNSNPIYAIVAIGFLIPAEKFLKKMFGFDKASSVGETGAVAGGALLMGAMNKFGHIGGKTGASNSGGTGSSEGTTPRYISSPGSNIGIPTADQYSNVGSNVVGNVGSNVGSNVGGNVGSNVGGNVGSNVGGNIGRNVGGNIGSNVGGNIGSNVGGNVGSNAGGNIGRNVGGNVGRNIPENEPSETRNVPANQTRGMRNIGESIIIGARNVIENRRNINDIEGNPIGRAGNAFNMNIEEAKPKGDFSFTNGVKTLGGQYINRGTGVKVLKAAGRGIVGAVGAVTLGTVGIAAGVASGDLGKTLQYGATGAGAGYIAANNIGDRVGENVETFKEGALGTKEYNTRKSIDELTRDNDFNRVCSELGIKNQEGRKTIIRQFHNNGITNPQDIKKAMNVRASNLGITQNEIIVVQKIRQQAKLYGIKNKEIEKILRDNGLEDDEIEKAMSLIDQL